MGDTFKVGDMAVYPAQGVVEVVDIEEKPISGSPLRLYVLRIVDTDMRIIVPVAKAHEVGLRPIIDEEEIEEVFEILKEKEVHIDKQTWNRRYRGFMEKIKTGSLFEVAEVYRDLYRLKSTKTLSFGERRMLDTAKNLIVKELSVAREVSENSMEAELEQVFSA
jgi:CarD family transcriptional regulator